MSAGAWEQETLSTVGLVFWASSQFASVAGCCTDRNAVKTAFPSDTWERGNGEKPDIHAKAKRMEYYAGQDMLQLTKEAVIWQGGDSFTGERITYDTRKGIIRAEKGKNQKDRVSVTIQPRKQ